MAAVFGLRIAANGSLDKLQQSFDQSRLLDGRLLASTACAPDTFFRRCGIVGCQFLQSAPDRAARNPGLFRYGSDPAPPGGTRFARRKQPQTLFIQMGTYRIIPILLRALSFRIGVHIGDVMVRTGDLFGDGVGCRSDDAVR
jgi:hypothetical protein